MTSARDRLAVDLVDAANALYGTHSGCRALHARGFGLSGAFSASGDAATLTEAPHLVEGTVPVLARFSGGSGDPNLPDRTHMSRGFAVRFETQAGNHDLLAVDSPVFLTPTPELFAQFLRFSALDPSDPVQAEKRRAWFETQPLIAKNAASRQLARVPASYSESPYYAIHAFELIGPYGARQFVRFSWVPDAPGIGLSDDEAAERPPQFLSDELEARLSQGTPIVFTLLAQLAEDDDDVENPAIPWPENRSSLRLGQLELTAPCDVEDRIFDPTHLVPGIECGPDPVLAARPGAYGVSYSRRTSAR